MNIISIIQNHFQQRRSISVPVPMAIACKTFDKLSRTGIVHGHKFNLFSNYYKFNVRWNEDFAVLDGPFRPKTMPLFTVITLKRGIGNTSVTLDMTMQIPRKVAVRDLFLLNLMNLVYLGLIVFSPSRHSTPLSIAQMTFLFSAYWILVYVFTWMYVVYSVNLIVKNLPLEFSMASGD